MKLTDKEKIIAYIDKLLEKYPKNYYLLTVAEFIDSLQEKPVSEDLEKEFDDIEQYARNEADKFASKEYEYYNDIGLLKKGFYWGCKAGANWQEQQIKKSAIYGIVAGRVKDEVFVASSWFKDDKLKPAEDIKLIIIKK